jgi:hypothetical protein
MTSDNPPPMVSILIPARNEAGRIVQCLESWPFSASRLWRGWRRDLSEEGFVKNAEHAPTLLNAAREVVNLPAHRKVRTGESITVVSPKGKVPFSSNDNWDSPPLISSPLLSRAIAKRTLDFLRKQARPGS